MANIKNNIAQKAKNILIEDTRKAEAQLRDAVKSRAYLYPIKGIYYFASHRALREPLFSQILPLLGTAIGITTFMFVFTYLPQAAVLTIINGPFAIISTVLLVLSESASLTNAISRALFIEDALLDTFDGTLLARNQTNLVSHGRIIRPPNNSPADIIARLGKSIKKPFTRLTPSAILRYLIYLPLNMIPIVGTILFIFMQARRFGPAAHARYFQLKGWNRGQRDDWVARNRPAYTAFGLLAYVLELVPFVGVLLAFTNTLGAALWAADVEDGLPPPRSAELRASESPEQEEGVLREEAEGEGEKKEL